MRKIILAAILLLVAFGAYFIGLHEGKKNSRLLLGEQYIRHQILESSFDQKGIRELKEGTKSGIEYLQSRIEFRHRDLNTKLEKETFWTVFLPSIDDLYGFDTPPEETYQALKAWNESYQQNYSDKK